MNSPSDRTTAPPAAGLTAEEEAAVRPRGPGRGVMRLLARLLRRRPAASPGRVMLAEMIFGRAPR